jgi:hypothetical protein
MQINVKSNLSAVSKAVDAFGRNQMPFATSRALNSTAFDVRSQIVNKTYPRSFTVRNKRFASALFRVQKSTKRKLVAVVFDRLGKDYMTMQAEGGIKRPRGNNIAIPTNNIKRLASGKVSKAKQPRNLLGGKAYKTKLRGGQEVIAQQEGRGAARKQKILYILEQSANIPKRFPFYEDGQRIAQREFAKNFAKAFREAKRTAALLL